MFPGIFISEEFHQYDSKKSSAKPKRNACKDVKKRACHLSLLH